MASTTSGYTPNVPQSQERIPVLQNQEEDTFHTHKQPRGSISAQVVIDDPQPLGLHLKSKGSLTSTAVHRSGYKGSRQLSGVSHVSRTASVIRSRQIGYTAQQTENFREIHKLLVAELSKKRPPSNKIKNIIREGIWLLDPELPHNVIDYVLKKPAIENFDEFIDVLKRRELVVTIKPPDQRKPRTSINEINDLFVNWRKRQYLPFSLQVELRADKAVWNIVKLNSDKKIVLEYLKICEENVDDVTKSPYIRNPILLPEYRELAKTLKEKKRGRSPPPLKTLKEIPEPAKKKEIRFSDVQYESTKLHYPRRHMLNFFAWNPPRPDIPDEPKYETMERKQTWKVHRELREKVLQCKYNFYEGLRNYVANYNRNFAPLKVDQMKGKQKKKFMRTVEIYSPSDPKKYHPLVKRLHEDEGF